MKCFRCSGTGSILARNGIDFTFSPGLSSTVACRCPVCNGSGSVAEFDSTSRAHIRWGDKVVGEFED